MIMKLQSLCLLLLIITSCGNDLDTDPILYDQGTENAAQSTGLINCNRLDKNITKYHWDLLVNDHLVRVKINEFLDDCRIDVDMKPFCGIGWRDTIYEIELKHIGE